MARCFVTRRLPGGALDRLAAAHELDLWQGSRPPTRDELLAHAREADVLCLDEAQFLDETLGEVVEELDISGGRAPEARQLEKLLLRCEQGASQGIVCWRVDRFSRDAADTLAAVRRLMHTDY
jgi:glyoxylate reductase